jgi:hypothetical protein
VVPAMQPSDGCGAGQQKPTDSGVSRRVAVFWTACCIFLLTRLGQLGAHWKVVRHSLQLAYLLFRINVARVRLRNA